MLTRKVSYLLRTLIDAETSYQAGNKDFSTMSTNELVAKNFFIEPNVFLSFDI